MVWAWIAPDPYQGTILVVPTIGAGIEGFSASSPGRKAGDEASACKPGVPPRSRRRLKPPLQAKARSTMLAIAALASLPMVAADLPSPTLTAAVKSGDRAAALEMLANRSADVNAAEADGSTALLWAAHWNDAEMVQTLLGAGANPNAANRYGSTPLSEAAALGSAPIIEALLKAGANPNTRVTADGETVLMTAARSGNIEGVKALLDRGADVNARESYRNQTALMWAAAERHTEIVKLLLAHGADWTILSRDRETKLPKLSAASSVSPFSRGGMTAFLFTAREGDLDTAKVMLDAGVNIDQTDVDGTSAMTVSIMNKHYTFAKFLLDRGADPNVKDAAGRAALYAAIDMRNQDWSALPSRKENDSLSSVDLIRALLARGANPNTALTRNLPGRSGMDSGDTTLDEGTTPLMRAARSGDAAVMRLLLEHGADPKVSTKDGNTALLFAAGIGYRDKNTRGSESEALEALKVCLEQGQDINQTNAKGETALHGAANRGADSIVKYLVEHGAKLDLQSKVGFTPLDIAMGKSSFGALPVPHDSTVALIRSLGGVEGKRAQEASSAR